ncbi:hypothetical protein BCO18175_07303 [Burkholderia contaminans]|uniref:DUF3800 domain-containing protein n=1 Tax=Burkholderia contaminans TaxID=488447 RepID=UPI001452AE10|nr:DUF3800 domain-containing protein [Burkholderia contaminans]VWD46783.1 hypothetical protein BCO18175_07303 [Burkholderia contaminans]
MYFYVDESGHTGPNLFDPEQPMLYYGVVSSSRNVDLLAADRLQRLRRRAGVSRLHAAELGNGGLVPLIPDLVKLQQILQLRFDLYRVAKPDHAIICFFDQVFDQGMNPAMTWSGYWTPVRYILLLKLATLFDEMLAKRAWQARIEIDDAKAERELASVCDELRGRVVRLPDARSRQLISDTLEWASKNAPELYYNTKTKKDRLQITPNIIGFQCVMHGIAMRIKKHGRKELRITVDQQSQFNKAQKTLSELFASMREVPWLTGPGLPKMDLTGMPTTPITFASSADSAGLELVDIYLWVFKRVMERKEVAPELYALVRTQLRRGRTDEISLNALGARWSRWFDELPEVAELTEEQMAKGRELLAIDESRRLRAVSGDVPQLSEADAGAHAPR